MLKCAPYINFVITCAHMCVRMYLCAHVCVHECTYVRACVRAFVFMCCARVWPLRRRSRRHILCSLPPSHATGEAVYGAVGMRGRLWRLGKDRGGTTRAHQGEAQSGVVRSLLYLPYALCKGICVRIHVCDSKSSEQ